MTRERSCENDRMKAPVKKKKTYCEIAFMGDETVLKEVWIKIDINDKKIIKRNIDLIKSIDLTRIFLIWSKVIAKNAKKEKETRTNDIIWIL